MPTEREGNGSATRRAALLLALSGLVHAAVSSGNAYAQANGRRAGGKAERAEPASAVILGRGADGLPPAILETRAALLAAVEIGDIAELRPIMDLNEVKPNVGGGADSDPIEHLRSLSADRAGKDVLATLGRLLEGSWAAIPAGRDIENNRIYVWPHFAAVPIAELDPDAVAALAALVGEADARASVEKGRYRGWLLVIGADGIWHMLTRIGD